MTALATTDQLDMMKHLEEMIQEVNNWPGLEIDELEEVDEDYSKIEVFNAETTQLIFTVSNYEGTYIVTNPQNVHSRLKNAGDVLTLLTFVDGNEVLQATIAGAKVGS